MASMDPNEHPALCTLQVAGMAGVELLVERWHGEEAVSRPYRFEATLACTDFALELERMLGARATLAVRVDGIERPWHGVLTRVAQLDPDEDYARYQITLEPRLALLREFRRSEVFLDKHLGDLIRILLKDARLTEEASGGGAGDFALRLSADALERTRQSFTCQFEESSLDFLARRLEREGVYYWFEQRDGREMLVFGDDLHQQPKVLSSLLWRPERLLEADENQAAVTSFQCELRNRQRQVSLRDFAARRADLDLTVDTPLPRYPLDGEPGGTADGGQAPARTTGADDEAAANGESAANLGEYAVYGEHYKSQEEGRRLARLRAQALATEGRRYAGRSRAPGLRAGHMARLDGHPRDDFNGEYYTIAVEHTGSQPLPGRRVDTAEQREDYENRFVALPADMQFRPPRVTRRPRIIGMLSALIDAEGEGKYAELNDNGCYKVVFPFARSRRQAGHNSAWIRMATPYAGHDHGMHLPLLKGTEVLIAFLSGDPDRPIIAAAVPNSENPNRLASATATQPGLRTAGGNALAFQDREGSQSVLLGSPVAASHISLGATADAPGLHGIRMHSQNHMNVTSNSYVQEVAGVYRMQAIPVGSGSDGGGGGAGGLPPAPAGNGGGAPPPATALTQNPGGNTTPQDDAGGSHNSDEEESPWYTKEGFLRTDVTHEPGGLVLTTFGGSSTEIHVGNVNDWALALKTDVHVGISLEAKMAGSAEFNFSERGEKSFTLLEKTVAKETVTNLTTDGTYGTVTNTIGTLSETIGKQTTRLAGNCTVDAGGQYAIRSVGITEITGAAGVKLDSPAKVTIAGAAKTSLGTDTTAATSVLGTKVNIGADGLTAKVDLVGMTVDLGSNGSIVQMRGAAITVSPAGLLKLG